MSASLLNPGCKRLRGHPGSASGSALLLQASEGLHGWQLAHHLAASWLCEAPVGPGHACGECASCRLVGAFTHPDLRWLVPEAIALERGWLRKARDDGKASSRPARPSPAADRRWTPCAKAIGFQPAIQQPWGPQGCLDLSR